MTDNIFDRLFELLQSPGPVNWKIAAEVTASLAGATEPIEPDLLEEYAELVRTAEIRLGGVPGMGTAGSAPIAVTDRRGWADTNLRSFSYLAEPLSAKVGDMSGDQGIESFLAMLAPLLLGMQMGSMVGFMSHRILGRFDVGLPVFTRGGAIVAPNVEDFARDHAIDPPQARLWVAMHEVAYRTAMDAPWAEDHFTGLMEDYFAGLRFDPDQLTARFESLDDPEELERAFGDPASFSLLVATEQGRAALEPIRAYMAFVEGYADYVMDELAPGLIPEAPRLREAVNRRRAEPSQGEQVLQRLIGLELRRADYQRGARFARTVAERWGGDAIEKIWQDPQHLPTQEELDDPIGWAARVLVDEIGRDGG